MTTAATLVTSCSERRTEPSPLDDELELAASRDSAFVPSGRIFETCVSKPNMFSAPRLSPFWRARFVVLSMAALSVMRTRTVTRSPMRPARWSLKKAREPVRQSELGAETVTRGSGIGMRTGR